MSLTAFLKENAIQVQSVSYVASERFLDEEKKPMEWKIRVLDSAEFDKHLKASTKRVADPASPKKMIVVTDDEKLESDLLRTCIEYPNLADAELQNSYGVVGEIELLRKMLTAGEFASLASATMQACGFEVGMKDRIEEAKN